MTGSASPSAFHITIEPSGREFDVAAGETILAAGISQGINLPYGCKDGACGSCKCKKISGTVNHGAHQNKALSDAEEAQGFVLTCCASPTSDVVLESRQVTLAGAFAIRKMPTRIKLMEKKSPDVMRLLLQMPANEVFAYHAGQYIEFLLQGGVRRSYSMASAPQLIDQGLELHIRHMPGGKFTDQVFSSMKERDILRIEGPYGSFYLREDSDKPIVLLASGTGFAPVKAIIEHLQLKGITRPVTLYWGGRRPTDLYMDAWVKTKLADLPNLRYVPVVSNALPEDHWQGRTGFVHRAVLQDLPDLRGHQVYACGAPIVVDSARTDYLAAGLPEDEFYADAFTSEADKVDQANTATV
ncbi:CDP-6-deoxy-delta-3,4-glucoseen reductase [Rhodoferax sp.]|uniref:CDP-6-deoxy-delta-3,4-glucoseen reductase n=1 Tax=Rhodoferax sp. TaxID=50421 RepID=UPI0025CF60F6|nr:CDP-6-deoxy-delta-3,4-glucoseen reductase [Rhodoferax sp.]MCM2295319.1 CDP-6-deoxy-delta-3,4-glucoseen reductase [Rhodoferax sp.]